VHLPIIPGARPHTRKVVSTTRQELRVGELRRQVVLHSEAVYRVCDWNQTLVEVEVVSAPGLEPGRRFHFTVSAVTAMTVVAGPGDANAGAANGS
jgi:hypothetical protein